MVLWGFRWFRLFLNPFQDDEFEHISESDRKIYILGRLEESKFSEWSWILVVAGVGFFTDSYSIFSINMVMPMLGIIYYDGSMPHNYETALSIVTLGGSIIGQISFGLGADIWGRRKMYGLELVITIGATLGVVMASNGTENSMSIIVWLLIWRFVLGIGIGADYPLSAVICSEFAPTRLRGKMLTLVFICQPLGQIAATLVALIATAQQRDGIMGYTLVDGKTDCTGECLKTLDSVWRWTIGVGVIPAVIALWFRLTIIESPRYTADVGGDSRKAASELARYLHSDQDSMGSSSSLDVTSERRPINHRHSTSEDSTTLRNISGGNSHAPPPNDGHLGDPPFVDPDEMIAAPPPSWRDFKDYFWHGGNLRTLMATSFCWFCVDLPFYGLGMNSPRIITAIWYGAHISPPAKIFDLLVHNVWQSLVVVSVGALAGCIITFVAIDKLGRKNIQLIGFFWLFLLFIIIGGSFDHLYESGGSSAIIVLYILCQIFFNFGPNTITYILPAELFPTRYRGLCHGISAAFGKLGSVAAQLFLAYINYGNDVNYEVIERWLQYSLLILSIFMLVGFFITLYWIPGNERGADGQAKTLEEWEVGRTANGFSKAWLARAIVPVYRVMARVWDRFYLWLDKITDGNLAEQRSREEEDVAMVEVVEHAENRK